MAVKNYRSSAKVGGVTRGQSRFSQIPSANIQRSSFSRNCGLKTNFDAGFLVPIFVDEALPGDTMNLKMSAVGRMATPLYPVMENMYIDYFFFAVPNRILWENWERMNGAQDNPEDSTDYTVPQMAVGGGGYDELSLEDYFGIPTKVPVQHTALFHRAYNMIWNEWFRDQNLQERQPEHKGDGPDSLEDYKLLRRGKRHDYFTSCLPWPQKGPAVELPLGTTAPVQAGGTGIPTFEDDSGNPATATFQSNDSDRLQMDQSLVQDTVFQWEDPALEVDLANATAATINELRESFQVQKMFERDARGGTRYTEILRSHFNVTSPDARMQRPEYLGGGGDMLSINPVAHTTTLTQNSVGDLAGYIQSVTRGTGFNKSFTEHCVIIGLACVRADLNYQQGLDRMWSRETRFDFYWPSLAHLGEQSVLNKEIYIGGDDGDDETFGYQERYAEYRYKPSKITGQMRSNADQPLDAWHLAQDFDQAPGLNAAFIEERPPIDRIQAVPTEPQWLFDAYFNYKCVRPMPTYSVPGLIDHF